MELPRVSPASYSPSSEDFTKATLASTYDLAIGNPPFSNRLVNAVDHRELRGFSLHDWFIARSVGALRPGGFAAFVTSRHTLDKTDQKARQHIAEEADLLGAVRLPAGAMRVDAGTEVVLDLLVFRKRMIGELSGDQTWLETAPVPDSDEGGGMAGREASSDWITAASQWRAWTSKLLCRKRWRGSPPRPGFCRP